MDWSFSRALPAGFRNNAAESAVFASDAPPIAAACGVTGGLSKAA